MSESVLTSPLRYPGSKTGLVDYVATLIHENLLTGCHFVETHAGGASLGLALLGQGVIGRLTLVEKDPLLYAFWKSVLDQPTRLCKRLRAIEVSLATWKSLQPFSARDAIQRFPLVDLGVAAIFLNRTNFSGVLSAGPIGGFSQRSKYKIGCRFNKDALVERIRTISDYAPYISIVSSDAITYLRKRSRQFGGETLTYLDPPYFSQGPKLYRYSYSTHQHNRLAEYICRQSFPWLVSYDRHPAIERLFSGQKIVPITLNYAVKQSRRVEELLISNLPLPEPIYADRECIRSHVKAA